MDILYYAISGDSIPREMLLLLLILTCLLSVAMVLAGFSSFSFNFSVCFSSVLVDLMFLNAIFYNKCEMIWSVKSWSLCFRMVVRILPPANNKCQCELGMKFGCQPKNVVHLLRVARELEVDVVGVR